MFERVREILRLNPPLTHHQDEESGCTMLHLAVKAGVDNVVMLLLEHGANPLVRWHAAPFVLMSR